MSRAPSTSPSGAGRRRVQVSALAFCAVMALPAHAAEPEIFRGADLSLGDKLLREHRCSECHTRRVGGDGSDIYNPRGRISTPGALRGMVDYCSTELRLQLFPEEVSAVAAVLNRDHYRFK